MPDSCPPRERQNSSRCASISSTYDLPPERIALEPACRAKPRGCSWSAADGALARSCASATCPDFLRPGDALVVNDTRVIAARLDGVRVRGDAVARIEATLIRRIDDSRWRALARPGQEAEGRRAHPLRRSCREQRLPARRARRRSRGQGRGGRGPARLRLLGRRARRGDRAARPDAPAALYRGAPRAGRRRPRGYQTVSPREPGAVAAPTAGLHFTPDLVARIAARGASLHRVTLHVGAGTFLPVKADDTADHVMHSEWGGSTRRPPRRSTRRARAAAGSSPSARPRLRLLESAADEAGASRPSRARPRSSLRRATASARSTSC